MRKALLNRFEILSQRDGKGVLFENSVYGFLLTRYENDQIYFWRTADGNKMDFVIKENDIKGYAIEVKWNEQQYRPSKYNKFVTNYPELPLKICMF